MSGVDVPVADVEVSVDTAAPVQVSSNGAFLFAPLDTGDHQVAVTGASPNCTSTSALTQMVHIVANTEDSVTFVFNCVKLPLVAHGAIAFSHADANGFFDIWVMNPDGTGQTDLTNSPNSSDVYPSWSADGSSIVFIEHGESTPQVAIIRRDGSGFRELTANSRPKTTPAVSPDGSRIAFSMQDASSNYQIWVMNIDGSGLTQLTTDTTFNEHPSWSPDGTKIVFERVINSAGTSSLVVMNADGSNVQQLTPSGGVDFDFNPSWSPDGLHIAFTRTTGDQEFIALVNPDGSNVTPITGGDRADDSPSWNADASKIAFFSNGSGSPGIWIMNADGSNSHQVSHGVSDGSPAWSK